MSKETFRAPLSTSMRVTFLSLALRALSKVSSSRSSPVSGSSCRPGLYSADTLSGEVTPEMILDTINPVAIQGLLDGALSNLVGIQDPVSGIEGYVQGVVFKIQSGKSRNKYRMNEL